MNLKAMLERRDALHEEMTKMTDDLETKDANGNVTETRAFTAEEIAQFNAKMDECNRLNDTINAIHEQRNMNFAAAENGTVVSADAVKNEERAFEDHIRATAKGETRAESNFTMTDNGAVVPLSIANKIITEVKALSPIFERATKYNVGGTLSIPYYDESEQAITTAYAEEFKTLQASSGKFKSITLKNYLAGTLCLVSRSLLNNSNFDLLSFIVGRTAISIAHWIEGESLNGTPDAITGLSTAKNIIEAKAATAITVDELIDAQEAVPDVYQKDAIWIMSRNTRKAIRKLRDGDGNLLLNRDATAKWGYTLFGKDVYVTDNAKDMEAGNRAIFYADCSGLAIKISENPTLEVLRELYAIQHAIGVNSWLEMDAKIENEQKIAVIQMATT